MINTQEILKESVMVVNQYAFTAVPLGIRMFHLNTGTACIIDKNDDIIESSMDDAEMVIALDCYIKNKKLLEK